MSAAEQRVAVITGAASGIGSATVEELLGAGYAVVGVDLAESSPSYEGGEVTWVSGDVTDPEVWAEAERVSRGLDPSGAYALVACAADIYVAPFLEVPLEEWRRLYEVNVIGVINGVRSLLPAMVARGDGAVAVCCSINSWFVEREIAAYSASKAALLSVTRTLAVEHARDGIRINAVCPGVVDTPLLRRHVETMPDPAEAERVMNERVPTGAVNRPEEIARMMRFRVSPDAAGLSGSAVVVDGGLSTTYEF
jgi:NAD(P)-dependent dehydrogenase (short-subunit alcohol dehydrogenase family)